MQTVFSTKIGLSGSHSHTGQYIEETHTGDEIIQYANEVLTRQLGLELCSFVGLESELIPGEDGDELVFLDQAGHRVEFTEELQLKAAIAVLNTNGHYFEAKPLH